MNSRLAKQLVKARSSVRKKLQLLKSDAQQSQLSLLKTHKPLTESLKTIVTQVKNEPIIKKEPNESYEQLSFIQSTPKSTPKRLQPKRPFLLAQEQTFETSTEKPGMSTEKHETSTKKPETLLEETGNATPDVRDEETEQTSFARLIESPAFNAYLEKFTAPLPRNVIKEMIADVKGKFDHLRGIRHDAKSEKFFIGDSPITFKGSDFQIKGINYKGTVGLYKLLSLKRPTIYTNDDLHQYLDILLRTHALHRNYDPKQQIQGDGTYKYTNIIKPMYDAKQESLRQKTLSFRSRTSNLPAKSTSKVPKKTGSGGLYKKWNDRPLEYVYWDDPNELVERLELLIRSKEAGNSGNDNEIVSIIEELKERKVISSCCFKSKMVCS